MTEDATYIVRKLDSLTAIITATGGGLSNKVPYTGANQPVDLNTQVLTAGRAVFSGTSNAMYGVNVNSPGIAYGGGSFGFQNYMVIGTNQGDYGTVGSNYNFGPGTNNYNNTDSASQIYFFGQNFRFRAAASGTAGTPITWTEMGTWNRTSGFYIGGNVTASALLHVVRTTEQFRYGYDASNYITHTTSSTGVTTIVPVGTDASLKLMSATSQKFSVWNATPDVQPTTAIAGAAFATNTSGLLDGSATYGGYTGGQIVAALKRVGILA